MPAWFTLGNPNQNPGYSTGAGPVKYTKPRLLSGYFASAYLHIYFSVAMLNTWQQTKWQFWLA